MIYYGIGKCNLNASKKITIDQNKQNSSVKPLGFNLGDCNRKLS